MGCELVLSGVNERRLGRVAERAGARHAGAALHARQARRPGRPRPAAAAAAPGPWVDDVASGVFLLAGMAFRFAWVGAGRTSALDDEAVAMTARTKQRVP